MNKVKLLTWLCLGLLLINLGLVWFIFSHKPNRAMHDGPKNKVIETLAFDANQIVAYEKLIDWHRSEIRRSEGNILELKNKLYATLSNDSAKNQKDSLILEIGKLQTTIENIHYKHFQDIKKLCKLNQLKAFENLTSEIALLFSKKHPK